MTIMSQMNTSYFQQSYGKMWLTGSVKGWYRLPNGISSYGDLDKWAGAIPGSVQMRLRQDAERITDALQTGGRKVFVFSGGNENSGAWANAEDGREAVLREIQSYTVFMHELAHLFGLPDLYLYGATHPAGDPTRKLDIMANSNIETFSSWSRMKLCWIPHDWVEEIHAPIARTTIFSLNDLDNNVPGIHVAKITWGSTKQYILLERRSSYGYEFLVDENKDSGKGILSYRSSLSSEQVVADDSHKFSIVFLDSAGFKLAIGNLDFGNAAQETLELLVKAKFTIYTAESLNKIQGLDEAKNTLQVAFQSYKNMDFEKADKLASLATTEAQNATIPQSYYDAKQLIQILGGQIQNSSFKTTEGKDLLKRATNLFYNATTQFSLKRFDEAKSLAQQGLILLQDAKEIESVQSKVSENQLWWAVPLAICGLMVFLVAALRKRKRS